MLSETLKHLKICEIAGGGGGFKLLRLQEKGSSKRQEEAATLDSCRLSVFVFY